MFETLIRRLAETHPTQLEDLIATPDLDFELAGLERRSLDAWFDLPADQRAPASAGAMCTLSDGLVVVAIFDTTTRAIWAVLEGVIDALPRFAERFVESACRDGRHILVGGRGPDTCVIKVAGGGPGNTPGCFAS